MPTIAELADRHRLYELAVQNPTTEIDFIDATYLRLRGRSARDLREDFCGSAAVACEWIRRRPTNRACGVDLDPDVLAYAHRKRLAGLSEKEGRRLKLVERDVLSADTGPHDIVLALNFSYWLLRGRKDLLTYFKKAKAALRTDGLFILDAFGGYDAFRVLREERAVTDPDGEVFTYLWEQAGYDPISGRFLCHIHFGFSDGSRLDRAFTYDWRLWTLPEIRELLAEAGFSDIQVYWQGWDDDGDPDGIFVPAETGHPDAGWIAYLTAQPSLDLSGGCAS